jgi:hypothetical protein
MASYYSCVLAAICLLLVGCIVNLDGGLVLVSAQNHGSPEERLKAAAGLYAASPPPSGFPAELLPALQRTVLITVSNFGYLNHLMNFKCFADRLGLKFAVFTMDNRIQSVLDKRAQSSDGSMIAIPWFGHGPSVKEQSSNFRSKDFNIISNRKFEAALFAMRNGYDVIFSDPDSIIMRDPMVDLLRINVDYAHSINIPCPL